MSQDMDYLKVVDYPHIYQIEVTEHCNLMCPMCTNKEIKNKQHISLDLIKKIVDNDYLKNTPYTELQMSGEPFLHPQLNEIVDMLKSTGTMLGLSTNLTIMNPIVMSSINKLDMLTISFDIFNKELYEQSRYPNKWENFIENLELLIRYIKPKVLLRIQLLRTEITEPKFKDSLISLNRYIFERNVKSVIIEWVSDCRVEARKEEHSVPVNFNTCVNPFLTVSIKADGTVVPCCYDFHKEIPLGNLYDQTLDEIWNGNKIKELRSIVSRNWCQPELCSVCMYKSPVKLVNSFVSKIIKFQRSQL